MLLVEWILPADPKHLHDFSVDIEVKSNSALGSLTGSPAACGWGGAGPLASCVVEV